MPEAIVRQRLADNSQVLRTWFEWDLNGDTRSKILVIEVAFDTDPNSITYDETALFEIEEIITDTLANRTAMIVSGARIVPKGIY